MFQHNKTFGIVISLAITLLLPGALRAQTKTTTEGARETGLLGYWRFDEGSGEETKDSSGNGNDGEVHGAEWVKGKFGAALYFGGKEAYVSIPNLEGLNGSNEVTVQAWVYWEGAGRYPNIITGGRWDPGGFLIFVSDNNCAFRLGKPGDTAWAGKNWAETWAGFLRFELGRWYHLAATFNRPSVQTYVNGELVGSAIWDYPVGFTGGLLIGTWDSAGVCHNGLIDEVKIYNRALTAEEVKASYAKEAGKRMSETSPGEKSYQRIIARPKPITPKLSLENQFVKLMMDGRARVIGLVDKATGKDYAGKPFPYFATIKKNGREFKPSSCSYDDGKLTIEFGKSAATVIFEIGLRKQYFVFKVLSVSGKDVEELSYLNLRAKPSKYISWMSGMAAFEPSRARDDDYAFCLRVLNLQSNAIVEGKPPLLSATCFQQYGLVGAGAALTGCPTRQLRTVLKEVVRSEGLPYSPLGGPWALDAPENRVSYLFSSVSEKNVDEWIELAKRSGIPIIHLCGWERSLGHYEPRADLFPNGMAGLKMAADKIHAAGLKIGMHTLTGCIAPNDSFVTPVPDKRLAKRAVFTLAESIGEKDDVIGTVEPLRDMDTIWAYASRGNVIQIDEELIQYAGFTSEPPYRFTGCVRGAFGTKVAFHAKGAAVGYLFAYYGCFYPDENSTLVDEIADCIAKVANEGGFDFLYMDGSEGMPGGWHGVSRMRAAIFRKINHPIRIEASEWGYHSWPFHSCIGAWDYPCWALKRFIDIHCRETEVYRKSSLLPGQLGWWGILGPSADYDAELPDDIEYLCCKALGYDAPMSFEAVNLGQRPWNARQDEYLTMIGRYERLRLAGYFSEAVREKLRKPKEEFRLAQVVHPVEPSGVRTIGTADGAWQLLPTDYLAHKVTGLNNGTNEWSINNRYDSQPVKLRIQALYSVAPYDSPDGLTLADFRKASEFVTRELVSSKGAADSITHAFTSSSDFVKVGEVSGCYTADSKRADRRGAWAKVSKAFSPEVNLSKSGALGVWIHGDGKGEVLNFQLTDPPQYYGEICSDHYVDVDFTGWRYFELPLRERDAERHGDYVWPYDDLYGIYRTPLVRDHVSALRLYYNDLPPNDTAKCYLSPIKALPVVKVKLANPMVTIAGRRVTFPVTLESGQSIEFESPSNCKLFDERGELLQSVTPHGDAPVASLGENKVTFECVPTDGYSARAKVTVIAQGKPLGGLTPREKVDWRYLRTEYDDPRLIRALDGKENEWDTLCRPEAKGVSLQAEIIVDRVGKVGAGYEAADALTVPIDRDDLSRFADSPSNQFAKYVYDSEHQGIPAKPGVKHSIERSSAVVKVGKFSLRFTATSARSDSSGWCAKGARFQPLLDLSKYSALGFWMHGDGAGESFKLQLRDTTGAWLDMVTPVDFTGWKYVEFDLRSEAKIDLSKIEYVILYYNGLPAGKTVTCYIDDIRALREAGVVRNPALTVAGQKVVFPVALSAGERLVYKGPRDCKVQARDGAVRDNVKLQGELPALKAGRNRVTFGLSNASARDFQMRVLVMKVYR